MFKPALKGLPLGCAIGQHPKIKNINHLFKRKKPALPLEDPQKFRSSITQVDPEIKPSLNPINTLLSLQ